MIKNNYFRYRDQIKTGDLIQFYSTDIFSKIIAFFIRWKLGLKGDVATHSAMAKWVDIDGDPRLFILESAVAGVCLNYLSNRIQWWLPHGDIYWHKMRDEHSSLGVAAADIVMLKIGTPYGFRDLVKQAILRVAFDSKNFFCSELVGYPWWILLKWSEKFNAPFPPELTTDKFGIYQVDGRKI
jgi:hypothetical protein